jgi:hypothetical protein
MTAPSPFAAATALSDALAAAVARVGEGLVSVSGRRWPITGIVQAKDLILTAAHAADREEGLRIHAGGAWHPAQLVGRDPGLDLALLRVPGASFSPVSWPGRRSAGWAAWCSRCPTAAPPQPPRRPFGRRARLSHPVGARVDATLDTDVSTRPGSRARRWPTWRVG